MSDNIKSSTIPAKAENATDQRSGRTRHLVALFNLALLPILAALFLAVVSKRQMQPMYGWISETPLAPLGDRLASLFGSQAFRLSGHLEIDRQEDAVTLVARMIARMPSHTVVDSNNSVFFGQIVSRNEERIELAVVDGRLNETIFLKTKEATLVKPLIHPEVELGTRDANFILRHENLRHFCLSPILVATNEGYSAAHDAYLSLSLLEDAFLGAFSPIIHQDARRDHLLHVTITDTPTPPNNRDLHHAFNADAWYDPDRDALVVAVGATADGRAQYLRHEGAHELCRRYELLGDYAASPIWLREGLAQYCESAPFGLSSEARMKILRKRRVPWEALLLPRSLEDLPEGLDDDAFYAQSWFLVRWLMTDSNRARFFRFLTENRKTPEKLADTIILMNALDATIAQLDADLDASIQSDQPAPIASP